MLQYREVRKVSQAEVEAVRRIVAQSVCIANAIDVRHCGCGHGQSMMKGDVAEEM